MMLQNVLNGARSWPLGPSLAPVALFHVPYYDSADSREFARMPQLGQHAVHVPGRRVVILEEEDAAIEVDLPRCPHGLEEEPEAAAGERSGDTPASDGADIGVVRVAGDFARTLAP